MLPCYQKWELNVTLLPKVRAVGFVFPAVVLVQDTVCTPCLYPRTVHFRSTVSPSRKVMLLPCSLYRTGGRSMVGAGGVDRILCLWRTEKYDIYVMKFDYYTNQKVKFTSLYLRHIFHHSRQFDLHRNIRNGAGSKRLKANIFSFKALVVSLEKM